MIMSDQGSQTCAGCGQNIIESNDSECTYPSAIPHPTSGRKMHFVAVTIPQASGNLHDLWKQLDESEKERHMLRVANADLAGALDNLSLEFNAAQLKSKSLDSLLDAISQIFLAREIAKLGDRFALDEIKKLCQQAIVDGVNPFVRRGKVGSREPQ